MREMTLCCLQGRVTLLQKVRMVTKRFKCVPNWPKSKMQIVRKMSLNTVTTMHQWGELNLTSLFICGTDLRKSPTMLTGGRGGTWLWWLEWRGTREILWMKMKIRYLPLHKSVIRISRSQSIWSSGTLKSIHCIFWDKYKDIITKYFPSLIFSFILNLHANSRE